MGINIFDATIYHSLMPNIVQLKLYALKNEFLDNIFQKFFKIFEMKRRVFYSMDKRKRNTYIFFTITELCNCD